jgi:hypothetical protein
MAFAHMIHDDSFDRDLRERRAHLMRLRFELARNGVWVQAFIDRLVLLAPLRTAGLTHRLELFDAVRCRIFR